MTLRWGFKWTCLTTMAGAMGVRETLWRFWKPRPGIADDGSVIVWDDTCPAPSPETIAWWNSQVEP